METNFQKEIASNLRGFFVTQIISMMVRNDIINKILTKERFKLKDFILCKNKKNLNFIFNYLTNIGYLKKNKQFYSLTELGRDIFMRYSSFLVPHSYKNYFSNLDDLITKNKNNIKVLRDENILGSGKTHMRYFFSALNYLKKDNKFSSLIDLGVGNGDFAILAAKILKLEKIGGVDFSRESVKISRKKIKKLKIKNLIIKEDAKKIEKWSKKIISITNTQNILVSMWFLIQEISSNSKSTIINFLNKLKKIFPNAKVILCELVKGDAITYSLNKDYTFMPEYMLFHDLSGQGVFSYEDLDNIIKKSKFKIEKKILFDELKTNKKTIPSCITYVLK